MRVVFSLVAVMLLSSPALVEARDKWWQGFYTGIGVGGGRIDADLKDLGFDISDPPDGTGETIEGDTFKTTALTYKAFFGYKIMDYFAIEAGRVEFDDPDDLFCFIDDLTGACAESRFTTPAELEMPTSGTSVVSSTTWQVALPLTGLDIFAVGILPFGERFDGFLKLGGIYSEIKGRAQERVVGALIPAPQTGIPEGNAPKADNFYSFDVAGGIGFNFNSDTGITIRTELEYFDIDETNDVWFLSLSAVYNFDGQLVK